MINTLTLVGRVVETPILRHLEKGGVVSNITLAVVRPFKNMEGNYDTDFIRCVLWEGIAENACEYCKKGDIIGIRGRISPKINEISFKEENKKVTSNEILVERIAFIHAFKK